MFQNVLHITLLHREKLQFGNENIVRCEWYDAHSFTLLLTYHSLWHFCKYFILQALHHLLLGWYLIFFLPCMSKIPKRLTGIAVDLLECWSFCIKTSDSRSPAEYLCWTCFVQYPLFYLLPIISGFFFFFHFLMICLKKLLTYDCSEKSVVLICNACRFATGGQTIHVACSKHVQSMLKHSPEVL